MEKRVNIHSPLQDRNKNKIKRMKNKKNAKSIDIIITYHITYIIIS